MRTTTFLVLAALTFARATIGSTLRRVALVLGFATALLLTAASASAADINVYFNSAVQSGLVGPVGGSGATWNQATTFSGAGLKDVSGSTTSVGFTTTLTNFAGAGNSLTLCKYAAYGSKGQSATRQLVINGLTAGRQYDVYLASYFSKSNSDKTTFSTTNTSPTTSPQTADNSLGSDTATTWTAGTNYVLFQSVVPDASNIITFTISNSGGNYLILNGFQVVDTTAAVTIPAAPTGLTATAGNQGVSLAWNVVSGATGYNVLRSLTNGGPYTLVSSTVGTPYADTAVIGNTTYYYVVSATNSTGESAQSSQVSATTVALSPHSWVNVYLNNTAQTSLAGPTGRSPETWNQVVPNGSKYFAASNLKDFAGNATTVGFTLTQRNYNNFSSTLPLLNGTYYIDTGAGAANLVISGLDTNKTYDFYLPSFLGYGGQNYATTFTTFNGTATIGAQTVTNNGNSSTWVKGGNYALFESMVPDATGKLTVTFDHASGTSYGFLNGFQLVESTVVVTTPAAPSGFAATAGNQSVALAWNAVTGATGYNVKRSLTDGGPYDVIGSSAGTAYSDTLLVNGTHFYYVVSATNSAGESANSTQASATPAAPPVPAAPTGLTATVGNQGVALAWNVVSGATGYKVMRALTDGGPYTLVGNTAGVAAYSDKSVVSNTTYYYVVSATNNTGEGVASSQASAATALIIPTLRILPLGDSITQGSGAPGGYRGPLYGLLVNAGFGVDFVGTLSDNSVATLPDPDHEGHGGYSISGIDAILPNVFNQILAPDVVLLHIGTNDFSGGGDAAAPDRLEQLIVHLATQWPLARIVVSNLMVRGEPANTAIQTYFNPFLPGIVARQAALGRRVSFTDMRSAVPLSDMPDSLHPDLAGYTKMANNWFNAISALYPPGGSTTPPVITNMAASSVTSTTATLNASLSCDAACDVYAYWGTVNGGTNAAQWANSTYVGSRTNVVANGISQGITNLTSNTTYYFTFRASPGNGSEVWATNVQYFGPSPVNEILTFGLAGLNNVVIGASNITWTVPYSTDVTTLAPTYTVSALANGAPSSGTSRDFTTPQTYTVTAQNGSTKNYLVTVAKAPASTAKDILTFGPGATINGTGIVWTVPYGTSVTNLAPTFTLSALATANPASGTARNFSTPQSYTITAEDHSTKTYQVTVTPSPAPWLNVYLNTIAQTGIIGPAGGAGTTWNRNLYSGINLLDAGGVATTVGFSTDLTNDTGGPSSLTMCKYANYASNNLATKQLVITGLTAGKQYDVYLASYFTNRDVTTFATTNTTLSASPQSADNTRGSDSGTTWVQGTNYVLFQGMTPDTNHTITFSINNGAGSYRILNGFQLVELEVPSDPYAAWLAQNGNLADKPANFLDFAFGAAAPGGASGSAGYNTGTSTATPGQPTTTKTTGPSSVDFRAVFSRRHDYATAGLSYTLQFSSDLNFGDGFRQDTVVTVDDGSNVKLLGTSTVGGVDVDVMSVAYPWLIPIGAEFKKPTFFRVMVNQTPSSN